jgi:hypothetical protein
MDLYKAMIIDCIVNDIDVCLKNGHTGAVLLTYCGIDAMSFFLSMPPSKTKVNPHDL